MEGFIKSFTIEQQYRRGVARRNYFRSIIHVFIIGISFIVNGCQKSSLELTQPQINHTEVQECIELICGQNLSYAAIADIEKDENISWVNVVVGKPCDATISSDYSIGNDTVSITLNTKGGTTENCSCTSRYRYECSASNNPTIVEVVVKGEDKKIIYKKSFKLNN